MRLSLLLRGLLAAIVLAFVSYAAVARIGPLPPLGPFLDPVHGVWSLTAMSKLPERETLTLPGLKGPVQVLYDDRAVPHIFASNSEDAARTLGYVVARDRLFQMEMRWRTAAGRLSEIGGDGLLELDRGMRRIGLAWSADRDFERIDSTSAVMRDVIAYAGGVNAYIDGLGRRLPLEYRLLGVRPSRWEPVYSLYLLKLMGWNLTYWRGDLQHQRLEGHVGQTAAAALFPVNSPIQQPIQPNGEREARYDFWPIPPPGRPDLAALDLVGDLESALGALAESRSETVSSPLGSNNWVVAPGRSASGHALLAGDPHLELTLPSIWYEAHLVVPDELDVYGVTIPSVPFVLIGFNRDVAWSFTNTGADVIDFYEEEFDDPEAPSAYLVDGEWRPLERRMEEFRGRGGRRLAVDTLYVTHRGPVVAADGRRLSMRWTVLESSVETEAFRTANRAKSVSEWLDALAEFAAPAQNGVVADRGGDIAIRSTGHFPLHPDGIGLEIRDGSVGASDWVGFWPVERYPTAANPQQGYLASANQQPIDPQDDPTYLGANWLSPWRAMRINQLLARDSAVTPDVMRRLQTDPGNARADMFLPFFLEAVRNGAVRGNVDPRAREAAQLLAEWDRRYTKENERAVLFEVAMSELIDRVWDELLASSEDGAPKRHVFTPSSAVLASLLHQPENAWWDDRRTPEEVEDRDQILVACLAAALDETKEAHGDPNEGGWRWEGIRHANIYHMLGIPTLSALDLPIQGGDGTLNPSSGSGRYGASWRMVVELGPEIEAWSIYPGGQSGNPLSPYYDDRVQRWVDGELDRVPFPRSPGELEASRVISYLELFPER